MQNQQRIFLIFATPWFLWHRKSLTAFTSAPSIFESPFEGSAGAVLRDSRNPTFGVNWGNVRYQIKPIGRNVDRNTLGFNNMPLKTNFLKENGGSPNFRGR
jgi:hypothetical protein